MMKYPDLTIPDGDTHKCNLNNETVVTLRISVYQATNTLGITVGLEPSF
jgi:hypothetical protein